MFKRSFVATACSAIACSAVALSGFAGSASAATPGASDRSAAVAARDWLVTQQQADGGFEVVGFPGFETPDAVLALAEVAQTTSVWSTTEAYAGVRAVVSTDDKTPLDALDVYAASGLSAGAAAKVIVLNAVPLGLDPAAFDPAGDGTPTNLEAIVDDAWSDDGGFSSPGALNATLYSALATRLIDGVVPSATVDYLRAAQTPSGGWAFDAQPDSDPEVDSTALTLQVFASAGVLASDPAVAGGLQYIASQQQASGAWAAFGSDDPNTTAMAIAALTAYGFDLSARTWRDTYYPAGASAAYVDPIAWIKTQQEPDGRIASPNDAYPPISTFATSQSIQALLRNWIPIPSTSYAMVRADSSRMRFDVTGGRVDRIPVALNQPVVAYAHRSGSSGWSFAGDGGVFSYDGAPFFGSLGDIRLNEPVVTAAATPSGNGYWLFAADGGVFTFGDAQFYGSLGGIRLNEPVVTAAATPSGNGYWLFAADGGVFTFGDAQFYGSLGGVRLNQPITAATPTTTGGYWLIASDGGVFSFGDAMFHGSLGGLTLNQPIRAAVNDGPNGYWLFGADGGVFTFGSARFYGSGVDLGGTTPVVAASH